MIISGTLILMVLFVHLLYPEKLFLKNAMLINASLIAGFPIALKGFQSLRVKMFSIELLVTIAIIGAIAIGEYKESAIVSFLFLFGAFLETRTLEKARSSLKSLFKMAPLEAVVYKNGKKEAVLAEEVQVGDHVIVQSGGRIPVDGKVISGRGANNEAAITGEAIPSEKTENDQVFSSTILDSGYLEIVAERVGEDTTFAKVLESVEEAQESKVKAQRFLERFASYYTPGIVILSVLVLLFTRDIHLTLTFLVIACPGALIISAPVSIVAGIGKAAKKGILIKGGNEIENYAKMNAIVFDKTGTLTEGKPQVSFIRTFASLTERELLQKAAQVEIASEHHIGRAIVEKAESLGLQFPTLPQEVNISKGQGIKASLGKEIIYLGNRKMLLQYNVPLSQEMEDFALAQEKEGETCVFVADKKQVLGVISIIDKIRPSAFEAIKEFKKAGIQHFVMLSGDNRNTAQRVAQQLGIDQVFAELLPEDKAAKVKACMRKGIYLAMIGDGINDAPAIATANSGIAVGTAATDMAMETANIVLMSSNLRRLSYAHQLAKATVQNMKQNMFFSVGVVFLLLAGVLFGHIHLASGMLIHEISVLLVILNAIRLVRYPGYQLNLRKWFRQFKASFYFPSVLARLKKEKLMQIDGCQTQSFDKFKECSRC